MPGRELIERLPPFVDIERREQAIRAVRAARRLRRRSFEAIGSPRFSRPEVAGLAAYVDFEDGFFVEAGANDGYRQSNTYFLERFRGWRGILIEAIPELFAQCVGQRTRARCINCALVEPEAAGTEIVMRFGDLESRRRGDDDIGADADIANWGWSRAYDVTVPGRTLNDILDEAAPKRVDLLSLDLEGQEHEALRGLDLDRHRPELILVEAVPEHERLPAIQAELGGRYEVVDRLGIRDVLFRARA